MNPTTFAEKAIKRFKEEITDNFFLFIQNDDELLQDYLDTISESDRKTVNALLGKLIAKELNVDNIEKGEPKSFLIKTQYTKHK